MAFLTFLGADAGSPTADRPESPPRSTRPGKLVAAQSGCLACHQLRRQRQPRPRSRADRDRRRLPAAGIARSLEIGPGDHALLPGLREEDPEKFDDLVLFLASLTARRTGARADRRRAETSPSADPATRRDTASSREATDDGRSSGARRPVPATSMPAAPTRLEAKPSRESDEFASEVRGMFDRIAGVYDPMNSAMTAGLHHRWRARAVDAPSSHAGRLRPSTSAAAPAT